jgi:hypothetical protein
VKEVKLRVGKFRKLLVTLANSPPRETELFNPLNTPTLTIIMFSRRVAISLARKLGNHAAQRCGRELPTLIHLD